MTPTKNFYAAFASCFGFGIAVGLSRIVTRCGFAAWLPFVFSSRINSRSIGVMHFTGPRSPFVAMVDGKEYVHIPAGSRVRTRSRIVIGKNSGDITCGPGCTIVTGSNDARVPG
jgi:hypothetical protein